MCGIWRRPHCSLTGAAFSETLGRRPQLFRPSRRRTVPAGPLSLRGFSVIDPGGNWLRISKLRDAEDDPKAPKARNLDQVVEAAARLGDSHDDEPRALKTLISGLARYTGTTPLQKTRAYLYRAELEVRLGRREDARASLAAAADQPLNADERAHRRNRSIRAIGIKEFAAKVHMASPNVTAGGHR